MSKQTAVEWYENKLIELDIDFGGHKNYWIERNKIRNQAKAMEKERTLVDYSCGARDAILNIDFVDAVKYYNETYGGDK